LFLSMMADASRGVTSAMALVKPSMRASVRHAAAILATAGDVTDARHTCDGQ
jgi:hypothetical protein